MLTHSYILTDGHCYLWTPYIVNTVQFVDYLIGRHLDHLHLSEIPRGLLTLDGRVAPWLRPAARSRARRPRGRLLGRWTPGGKYSGDTF